MLNSERRFPKSMRLTKPAEFRNAFNKGKRLRCRAFTFVVTVNKTGHPRLGLAVSRKAAARASDRNRLKRIIRESFRCTANSIEPLDIVVQATPIARTQSSDLLFGRLEEMWGKLS